MNGDQYLRIDLLRLFGAPDECHGPARLAGHDHVGPAFGDATPVDGVGKAMLAAQDAESIDAICRGDAAGFLGLSRAEQDRRNICGLSPIYMSLKLIGEAAGESVGYAQCPADATGGSLVSIVGAVLWEE